MNNTQQHSLESCPLNPFGCITTTDTAPYRILDLDLGALDLFLSGYEYDRYHRDQLHSARSKTLEFLRGLNVADVLLPDSESCLLMPSSTTTTDAVHSYLISEDAILSHNNSRSDPYSSLKSSSTARRVHACIHHSSSTPTSIPSHCTSHSSRSSTTSPATGCRYYLVKDVTEMHGLAIAARNGIRASGRLAQPQQSPTAFSRTSSSSTIASTRQQQPSSESGQTFKKPASVTLLRSRDSGIMLDDEYWHHYSNSSSNSSDNHNSNGSDVQPALKIKATTIQDPGLLILQVTQFGTIDHAFAIPQSAGEAKRRTGWSSISSTGSSSISITSADCDNNADNEDVEVDTSVFLAHDRVAIEAMASDAVMAYVHPQELSALCKGLDQVCKALYTVFRARWRVDAPSSSSSSSDDDDDDDDDDEGVLLSGKDDIDDSKVCGDDLNLRQEQDRQCRIIEFQGERFEEWVDPSSAAMVCVQGMSMEEEEEEEIEKENSCRYAWTEVTGVLSNGNVVLVVRPLTMPEVEEQEWLMASPSSSSVNTPPTRYLTSSSQDPPYLSFSPSIPTFVDNTDDENEDEFEDEDGYLEMEMEMELGSLCSEQTLVQDDGEFKVVDWRAQTDEVRKRMDLEEGLCLSKSGGVQAVSRLSDLSSLTGSSSVSTVSTVSSRRKLDTTRVKQQQQVPCHSNRRPLLITFSPTAAASSLVLVSLPVFSSIALDAWKQWIQLIHLTREQFQAWSEYLLDLALGQTIETVSFGMTLLGCAPRPCLSVPSLMDDDYCYYYYNYDTNNNQVESDSGVQQTLAQELCQRTAVTIQRPHPLQEDEAVVQKISGLNRAGKVLEAHYPGLEEAVRHLGQSWLGHRIMATVQLEERLDVVADQVVDWWESEDRVATLVASSVPPLLNTLTAYTPISFLARRFVLGRTSSS